MCTKRTITLKNYIKFKEKLLQFPLFPTEFLLLLMHWIPTINMSVVITPAHNLA